ncbi:MAG: 3'-5' exonuclease [Planctomycetota bacterium]|nr:3'-5' exonuclease [Planctomycetota bacterium]
MTSANVRYLVFDVESVADGDLIAKIRYPGDGLNAEQAIERYRAELLEKYESEFIPYTFQIPISIAIMKVDEDLRLIDIVTLDEPDYRPEMITRQFWQGWDHYRQPTLVSFNGRTFDIPLLELAAFRYGISAPNWFNVFAKSWEQRRARYNQQSHIDLQDMLTNFGASRFNGGLNLVANLLGKPGKMGIAGHMVQDLFAQGEVKRINDYCRCDVLDTYFVFLRFSVMLGTISIEQERERVAYAKQWLEERAESGPAYREYLDQWQDWQNPFLG